MESELITKALGLPAAASDRDILDRIADLREAAGEDSLPDLSDRELLTLGLHESVNITESGATVTLYVPIKSGTEEIRELTIRRPLAKHIRKMQETKGVNLAQGLALLVELTGRSLIELERLDASDTTICMNVCSFLQRPPRRTGPRS